MGDDKKYQLPDRIPFGEVEFTVPKRPDFVDDKYLTRIENGWKNGLTVDSIGWLWVDSTKLTSILCTSPQQASYYIAAAPPHCKSTIDGVSCILGSYVLYLLDKQLQSSNSTTGRARTHSRNIYTTVSDVELIRERRTAYFEFRKKAQGKLKSARMKLTGANIDELTGDPLIVSSAEFHHIFGAQLFPELALKEKCGLVINRTTHETVTSEGALDAHQLFTLCKKKKWETKWYHALSLEFPSGFPRAI